MRPHIESFLSARLHLSPQIVGDRIYFISNLSGRLSLFGMYYGGSVPEPLLPPDIALPNPTLIDGHPFCVFPKIGTILVMLDQNGDENYQPVTIPIEGGYPQPAFDGYFGKYRVHLGDCDDEKGIIYLNAESRETSLQSCFRGDLRTNQVEKLAESEWGALAIGRSQDHSKVLVADRYSMGDNVLFLLESGRKTLLLGTPIEQRKPGEEIQFNGLGSAQFTPTGMGALITTSLFDDRYSLGAIDFDHPGQVQPVKLEGFVHTGAGELHDLVHLKGVHYGIHFNIDGNSWLYEGYYNEDKRIMTLRKVIVGDGDLAVGVLQQYFYDRPGDRFVLSFSTATGPSQLYTVESKDRETIVMHTDEKLLGIPEEQLSQSEAGWVQLLRWYAHPGAFIPAGSGAWLSAARAH